MNAILSLQFPQLTSYLTSPKNPTLLPTTSSSSRVKRLEKGPCVPEWRPNLTKMSPLSEDLSLLHKKSLLPRKKVHSTIASREKRMATDRMGVLSPGPNIAGETVTNFYKIVQCYSLPGKSFIFLNKLVIFVQQLAVHLSVMIFSKDVKLKFQDT